MERDYEILDDFEILEDINLMRRTKIYKPRTDPFELDDTDFYSRYRFDKDTAQFIINMLDMHETESNRGLPVPNELQVLCTLRFLGRNVHQSDIADLHGLSQPTVSRIIKNITRRIALHLPNFVQFPSGADQISDAKYKFYNISRFPSVIGAIDCTHVRIKCPTRNVGPVMAGHFRNRKGFYSLNVQIVCDADCKILDIVARTRGSVHDARIWNMCRLKTTLEATKQQHTGVLLGDGGYPASSIMLTPVRNPLTEKEQRYNRSHIHTRAKIECLNGQLKSKFQSALERIRVDLNTAKNIIVAIAVLHNISKERNLPCSNNQFNNPTTSRAFQNFAGDQHEGESGRAFRTAFINRHF